MTPKTIIFGLCIAVFVTSLIAMFFCALSFSEQRDKAYWRNQAEIRGELAREQSKRIDELEKENEELTTLLGDQTNF